MKKLLAILLALAMIMGLCACSSMREEEEEIIREKVTEAKETEPEDTEPEKTEPEKTEPEKTEPMETDPPETEPEETAPGFQMGTIIGNTYENPFLGMGFRADDDWYFYTEEQVAAMGGASMEIIEEKFDDFVKNATVIYDMAAEQEDGFSNLVVNFEKVSPVLLAKLDLEKNMKNLIPVMEQMCLTLGYSDPECELKTKILDGEKIYILRTYAKYSTMDIYIATVQIPCDGYIACLTITCFWEDQVDDVLDNFYFLD